jgi:phosphatidylserine/phosphatidylglycerophosphate/cardiolipin synthase-like enzyme
MAKFIRNKGLVQKITDVIEEANKELFILSPYYYISKEHLEGLKEASSKRVKIILIYSKAELRQQEVNKLAQIKNLEVRYIENLHAKCYLNEDEAIISTMNLHEYSINNNFEMGVLFGVQQDIDNYNKVRAEIERIYKRSERRTIQDMKHGVIEAVTERINPKKYTEKARGFVERKFDKKHHGFCIRTGVSIKFNIEKPFSLEAYKEWAQYYNFDYPEKYCHFSGELSNGETSMEYPIMRKNWDKAVRMFDVKSKYW